MLGQIVIIITYEQTKPTKTFRLMPTNYVIEMRHKHPILLLIQDLN